ncbi:MAG: hypothetical protein U0Q10_07275 [Dermatophilaceae bacterium]
MSPLIRMAAATVLAMGAPGALAVLPQAAAAPMQPRYSALPAESGSSAGLAKFGACLYGKKTADVVLLLDESGSLQGSDPDGARVTAAKYLVKQWSALSLETGVKIAIQTMGFSGGVQDASGRWLDAGRDLPQLKNDLDGFRTRDTGQQTDYWMALDGARKALTQRAAKGGSSCQAVLWFSDGKLDAFATYPNADGKNIVKPYLEKKTDDATANAAAAKDLCRTGGLADQVRSSGIATFGIGLAAKTATADDLQMMRSIALGENNCGAVSAKGTGDFHLATDIDQLILAFDALRAPGSVTVEQLRKVCQGQICPTQAHKFVLDNSITRVHVAASANADGLKLFVVPPSGKAVEVPMAGETQTTVGPATVAGDGLTPHTVSLDFGKKESWTGEWSVVFVDPNAKSANAQSITKLELSADIEPVVTMPAGKIYAGGPSDPVKIGLQSHDGKPIDPASLLGKVAFSAVFTDAAGTEIPVATDLDAAALAKPMVIDLTDAAEGTGTLTASVNLTTAEVKPAKGKAIPGTKMAPATANFDVPVLPPPGFPVIGDKLTFGTATGLAKLETTIKATGPGCVWFDAPQVTASPEKAGTVGVSSSAGNAASCVQLAGGESKDIPVTLTTTAAANGSVNGTITAHLAQTDKLAQARTKSVAFVADLDKPANPTTKWATFALVLLGGIGVPLALMYLVKRVNSKIPALPLLGGTFDVAVENGLVTRAGMPFALQPSELRDPIVVPTGGATALTVGEAHLRVRNGWLPFGPGSVLAAVAGAVGVSQSQSGPRKDGGAELPLAIHNNWALFTAPERGPGQGRLLLLVSADAPPEKRQDMIDRALAEVPKRLDALAGAPAAAGPSGLVDPGGAGGADGPLLTHPDGGWASPSPAGGGSWAVPATSGAGTDSWQGGQDPWGQAQPGPRTSGGDPWSPSPSGTVASPWGEPAPSQTMAAPWGEPASSQTMAAPWGEPAASGTVAAPWSGTPAPSNGPIADPWAAPSAASADPWALPAPSGDPRTTPQPGLDATAPRTARGTTPPDFDNPAR